MGCEVNLEKQFFIRKSNPNVPNKQLLSKHLGQLIAKLATA